jgi:hypothetical protein
MSKENSSSGFSIWTLSLCPLWRMERGKVTSESIEALLWRNLVWMNTKLMRKFIPPLKFLASRPMPQLWAYNGPTWWGLWYSLLPKYKAVS